VRRSWILGGWLIALLASALPALWMSIGLAQRNPLDIYVDPASGAPTVKLYWQFVRWWLPIAAPVSVLALVCLFLNRPQGRR
jgi:hypothetical protein